METLAQHSEAHACLPECVGASICVNAPARTPDGRSPSLRLVSGRRLTLARPLSDDAPEVWQSGISCLAQWLGLDVAHNPQQPESGLRKVTAWAKSAASAPVARAPASPVFAPWRSWSPVSLQGRGNLMMPRASWVASYLYDHGAGRPNNRGVVDIQLLSPLLDATASDASVDAPMPRASVLQTMIQSAAAQGRSKIAIVTDVRRRNAIVRLLLQIDRSITRDGLQIEVLLIENALCEVAKGRSDWDAVIVLPDLRSLMFAMLAQVHEVKSPWPMVWHHREGVTICSEMLDETTSHMAFDGPLLVQTFALAASQTGLSLCARRLIQGAARLWDCGIVTPGRGSVAPYVTEISDAEFIDELCRGVAGGQRTVARWRAIPEDTVTAIAPRPTTLTVVGAD